MKFGIFYELIALKPHDNAAVVRSYKEALEQIKFAEEMGFEYVWETEHHFLEKFSYSAAPELFLTAVAQNTKKIRVGHGAVLLTMNHPVRVAERAAVLDILSDGRLEFGTARGVTEAELGGFMIEPEDSRPMWEEALRMIPRMWMSDRFEWNGRFFKVPPRNVIPKPVQQPHPPLWFVSIGPGPGAWIAEQKGTVGTFLTGRDSKLLFDTYRRRCVALGWGMPSVDKLAYMGIVAVAETEAKAKERAHAIAGYIRTAPQLAPRYLSPPGYVPTRIAAQAMRMSTDPDYVPAYVSVVLGDGSRVHQRTATIDQLIDAHVVFAGTPDQVVRQIGAYHRYVGGFGNLLMMGHGGALSHKDTVDNFRLFAREVLPRLQELPAVPYELPPERPAR